MQPLSEKKWAHLSAFGDEAPFNIKTTSSSIDGIRLFDGSEESVPYVTRTDANNGISRFVSEKNYELGSDGGGCITVGLDTQTAFYQPHKFVTGQNVHIITGEKISENVAQFMLPVLRRQMNAKFNWGGNGATLGRMKRLSIMLPTTDSGVPDYEYMEQYAASKRNAMLERYKAYAEKRIAELKYKDVPALSEKKWEIFYIGDLFEVSRPKARNKDDYIFGDTPFVASGAINNGVMKCCQSHEDEELDNKNCITVSPVDGSSFYQPINFLGRGGAGSSILILRNSNLNLFCGEFIARAIQQTCSKYTYGHMGNKDSIKRERIMLPVTDVGEPDYEYMEQYAKNMMLKKYEQYFQYVRD